jgi:hypothetical protein
MGAADTGEAARDEDAMDRSVQVFGTFGGGSITIEGSHNGADWATLKDVQGNALVLLAAGIKQILEATKFIRPVSAGVTSVTVIIFRV